MTSVGRPLGPPLPTGGTPVLGTCTDPRVGDALGQRFATDSAVTFCSACASADERGWQAGARQWSPRPAETAALVAVASGSRLALAVLRRHRAGCWSARAALLLSCSPSGTWWAAPATAGPDGVDVRTWRRGRHLPWSGLRVRVRESRRLGVRSRTLELDTAAGPDDDGVLVVLARRDLGADPEEVARALPGARPRRPP